MTTKLKSVVFLTQLEDQNEAFEKAVAMSNFSDFARNCLNLFSEYDVKPVTNIPEAKERLNYLKDLLANDELSSNIYQEEISELESIIKIDESKKERIKKQNVKARIVDLKARLADGSIHRSTHYRIKKKIEQLESGE